MGLIDTHNVEYITKERDVIEQQIFINIATLKRGPRGGLKMIHHGHRAKVSLHSEKRRLYAPKKLNIKLDKEDRVHHIPGTDRVKRGMAHAAHMGQAGTSYPAGELRQKRQAPWTFP